MEIEKVELLAVNTASRKSFGRTMNVLLGISTVVMLWVIGYEYPVIETIIMPVTTSLIALYKAIGMLFYSRLFKAMKTRPSRRAMALCDIGTREKEYPKGDHLLVTPFFGRLYIYNKESQNIYDATGYAY